MHRYEHYGPNGKEWTKWFQEIFTPITDTEEELKEELKKCKALSNEISKKTKMKDEYIIEKFEYNPEKVISEKPKKGKKKP